jgi:hypothetical protein
MARQQWARPGIGTAAFPLVTENPVSAGARNTVLGGFQLRYRGHLRQLWAKIQ